MRATLRQSMDFLHTWTGLLFGGILFLVFFMGTLAVFDREIDRWMLPQTRLHAPSGGFSLDADIVPRLRALAPDQATFWSITYPDARTPTMQLGWRDAASGAAQSVRFDVAGKRLLPQDGSWGGTEFFYRLHYNLLLPWKDAGIWIVGLAAMAMLAALVSGVIVHRRIFADFFTFRPQSSRHRATLDVHNFSSVLLLPFHFAITLSGLIIFFTVYMPAGIQVLYGGAVEQYFDEAYSMPRRVPASEPAGLASLDAMVREARRRWGGGEARFVRVQYPGDRAALVHIGRAPRDRVAFIESGIYFDGPSGAVLGEETPSAALEVREFIAGLHLVAFEHWWLRWLYFFMGLASCGMLATGMLLWVDKRIRRHWSAGFAGWRVVDAAGCAGSLGVVVATLTMLVANRLVPEGIMHRAEIEAWIFFAAWSVCGAHAWLRIGINRRRPAWREQCMLIAVLGFAAPLLNWLTTGDHLPRTIATGQWAVAGVDVVLLSTGIAATLAVRKLTAVQVPRAAGPRPALFEPK